MHWLADCAHPSIQRRMQWYTCQPAMRDCHHAHPWFSETSIVGWEVASRMQRYTCQPATRDCHHAHPWFSEPSIVGCLALGWPTYTLSLVEQQQTRGSFLWSSSMYDIVVLVWRWCGVVVALWPSCIKCLCEFANALSVLESCLFSVVFGCLPPCSFNDVHTSEC
jgi:hypothetical protein